MLEHHFFQNFGERVTAGIGGVFLLLGYGDRVRIEKMAHRAIAADQNKLAERLAGAALFEQPEEAFDGDIDYFIRRFLAGGAMNDVADASHGAADDVAVGDIAADDFEPIVGVERAIVAESANRDIAEVIVSEDATNEIGADFAGRAGDENAFHEAFLFFTLRDACDPSLLRRNTMPCDGWERYGFVLLASGGTIDGTSVRLENANADDELGLATM